MPSLTKQPGQYTPQEWAALGRAGSPPASPSFYTMRNIPVFRPGRWNDEDFDLAFVRTLADNFNAYCTGAKPWYRPYLTFNHGQTPVLSEARFGRLTKCGMDADGQMYLDAEDIPEEIAHLVNARMFPECSIEFVRPKRDAAGNVESGFIGPDGAIVEGPVVKCLTLLGNDLPAVRGMESVPLAVPQDRPADKYAFTGGVVSRFSSRFGATAMETRDQMVSALQALGVDVSSLTDAVPDEFLASVLKAWRDANAAAGKNPATEPTPDAGTAVMADMAAAANAGLVAPAGATRMGDDGRLPSQIIHKFALANPGVLTAILTSVGKVKTVVVDAQAAQLDKLRDDAITAFFSEMSASGQVTPAQQAGLRVMLSKLDNVQVAKFSVGGKDTQTTALAAAMAEIKATFPVVKPMGHQTPQPAAGNPNTGAGTGNITPDRVKAILGGKGNAVGRAALAKAGIK